MVFGLKLGGEAASVLPETGGLFLCLLQECRKEQDLFAGFRTG